MTQKSPKKIRFGLTAIKGLGEETVEIIIQERKNGGAFLSLDDLAKRLPARLMNKKTLEALAFSGALDVFGDRKAIVESLEDLSKFAREHEDSALSGQIGLFESVEESSVDFELRPGVADPEEILAWEKSSLGLYVSSHPLEGLESYFEQYGTPIGNIDLKETLSQKIVLHGLVNSLRKIITKKGKSMALFELEDTSGKIECAVFPAIYEKIQAQKLVEDAFLKVKGKVEEREGTMNCIVDTITFGDLKMLQSQGDMLQSEKPNNDFETIEIEIPKTLPQEKLTALKKILLSHKVEAENLEKDKKKAAHYKNFRLLLGDKKVEVPFVVHDSESLGESIKTTITVK